MWATRRSESVDSSRDWAHSHAGFTRTYEVVEGGFVTPTTISGVPGSVGGCVYRNDGTKVAASERLGGHSGDWMITQNPSHQTQPGDARHLRGTAVYLGHFMGRHYGHFLTETLSTFWVFEEFEASSFDWFIFNPFIFGHEVLPFAHQFLSAFDIPLDRLVMADRQSLRPDVVLVPERLLRLNAAVDRRVGWVSVTSHLLTRWTNRNRDGRISRAGTRAGSTFNGSVRMKSVSNVVFLDSDSRLSLPELLPTDRQLRLFANADVVAGLSGSALHNSLFMKPGATVVEIGDPRYEGARSPTQELCDSVTGVQTLFIRFRGYRFGLATRDISVSAIYTRGCAQRLGLRCQSRHHCQSRRGSRCS